jgi:hypothetical protein
LAGGIRSAPLEQSRDQGTREEEGEMVGPMGIKCFFTCTMLNEEMDRMTSEEKRKFGSMAHMYTSSTFQWLKCTQIFFNGTYLCF